MKKLPCLLVIFLLLMGCGRTTIVRTILSQADACMNEYPDSAYHLLQTISSPQNLRGKEQADYALLYTQSSDKIQKPLENDSLIRVAVDYYQNEEQNLNAAKSYFYWGKNYWTVKDYTSAVDAFLIALRKMPKECTEKTLALIYYYLGDSYYEQEMYLDSRKAFKESYNIYMVLQDTVQTFFPIRAIAKTFLLENNPDSCLVYSYKALNISETNESVYWKAIMCDDIARVFFYQKNDAQVAFQYVDKSLSADTLMSALSLKGKIYQSVGQLDSAIICLNISKEAPAIYTKASGYNALYELEKERNNYKEACAYADSFMVYMDSIHALSVSDKIMRLNQDHQLKLKSRLLKEKEKQHYYILSAITVCLAFILIAYHQYRLKKQKEIKMQQQSLAFDLQLDTINDYMEERLGENTPIQISIEEYEKHRLQESIRVFVKTGWPERIESVTPEQKRMKFMPEEEQKELYKSLDEAFATILHRMGKIYPKMNEGDAYFCILSLMGYKTRTISYCTKLSTDALRSRKSRLKKSMSEKDFHFFFEKKNGVLSFDVT